MWGVASGGVGGGRLVEDGALRNERLPGPGSIVSSVTGLVRPGRSATDTGVGFIGGLNGTLVYRLTEVWGLRAGYNLYWLTNAALAPTQYDFGLFADSGSRVNDNGGLFLHGANLGVEARW